MNITRIQQDLLKDVLNGKADNWYVQSNDSEVCVFTKSQVYILDPKDFLLNLDKLTKAGVKGSTQLHNVLDYSELAKPAVKTGVLVIKYKITCLELECQGDHIYINQALLKYYDSECEFSGTNSKSPVYIYESDILVGLVLPVKM